MTDFKTKMLWMNNGDLKSIAIYPEKEVSIKVKGVDTHIGTQPSYRVENVIVKASIPDLVAYLEEQKEYLVTRLNSAKQVMQDTDGYDKDGLLQELRKIPQDLMKSKHTRALNQFVEKMYMRENTKSTMKLLEESLDNINNQLEFINKGK